MKTGEIIKQIRLQKGLTQKQLGELCGIDPGNLRKYESGKLNPKIETLKKISDALEISASDLCGDERIIANYFSPIVSQIIDTSEAERNMWDSVQCSTKKKVVVSNPEKTVHTIAAHFDGDEFTPEELEEIKRYAEFLKSKRK